MLHREIHKYNQQYAGPYQPCFYGSELFLFRGKRFSENVNGCAVACVLNGFYYIFISTFDAAFSTAAEQAEQDIPVILYF